MIINFKMKQIDLNTLLKDLNEIEIWRKSTKSKRSMSSPFSEIHVYHTKLHSFRVIVEEKTTYSIPTIHSFKDDYPDKSISQNQPTTSYHLRLLRDKKILQEHNGDKIKRLYETIDNKFK